jgi:uncharacterized membrane protein HdeD (DUF308 family)
MSMPGDPGGPTEAPIGGEPNEVVAAFLQREIHLPDEEARVRASELVRRLGLGTLASVAAPLVQNWWLFLLRGLLAILFGVLTLVQPAAALAALVFVFGVWAFIDGVNALTLAIAGRRSWQLVIVGLIGIAAGAITFWRPGLTALGLYALFAGWSIARGIVEIAMAVRLRDEVRGEVWMVLGGLISIAFGVLLIVLPASGVLAVAFLIGIYALLYGLIEIALSFRLRGVRERARHLGVPTTPAPQPG